MVTKAQINKLVKDNFSWTNAKQLVNNYPEKYATVNGISGKRLAGIESASYGPMSCTATARKRTLEVMTNVVDLIAKEYGAPGCVEMLGNSYKVQVGKLSVIVGSETYRTYGYALNYDTDYRTEYVTVTFA